MLSAQPVFDLGQLPLKHSKLAMPAGTSRHYRLDQIVGRHFVQTGKVAGLGSTVIRQAIEEILERAPQAPGVALAALPAGFAVTRNESVSEAVKDRTASQEAGQAERRQGHPKRQQQRTGP